MTPLSKIKLKLFLSLSIKKYRQEYGLFLVEGIKMTKEALLSGWDIQAIIVEDSRQDSLSDWGIPIENQEVYHCETSIFKQLSSQNNPEGILAVIGFPDAQSDFGFILPELPPDAFAESPGFILDNIQDPGNVGTILRIADWFGMKSVICTEGTADVLNAKTLRGSMGSVFRIKITYVKSLFPQIADTPCPILLADMQGESLEKAVLSGKEWILLGNEANGVNPEIAALSSLKKIHISGKGQAESLNVAVSAGIFAYRVANP